MSTDLVFLGISLMVWGVGEGMFFIFQPLYLQELGANPVTIGAILGIAAIVMSVAHIPAGHLADKIGRKPLLMVSWVIGVLATWIMALATTLPIFVFGLMIYNLTAFVSSPLSSYVTAARGKLSVARSLTLISALYNSGAILGPWLGGQVGQHFGLKTIYLFAAISFMLSSVVLFFIKSQPIDKHDPEGSANTRFMDKRFITYQSVIFLAGFSMYLAQPLSANFLQNQHHLTLDTIGILGSITSIGVVILNLGLGNIKPHIGYMLGQLFVGMFALILWQGTTLAWFSIAYFMVGGYRISRSLATAQTRELVQQSRMGLAYGITETVSSSAIILASPVAGLLYEVSPSLMYVVGFCLILVSLLVSARFNPHPTITA
jgi:MFS family permease